MLGKPCFFFHSGTAFVALPCTWLVSMTCCSYGVQDSKKSGSIRCFLRPPECFFLGIEPSTCCCSSVFRPNGHSKLLIPLGVPQLWVYLQPDNIFLPAHLRLLFSVKEPHDQTNATRRATVYMKENCSLSSANAP